MCARIPAAAVKRLDRQDGVWQLADGRVEFRPVKVGITTLDGRSQIVDGLNVGDEVVVHSERALKPDTRVKDRPRDRQRQSMINLAGRDILYGWGKFVFTGLGLGLLVGLTLSMAGIYRGSGGRRQGAARKRRRRSLGRPARHARSLRRAVERARRCLPDAARREGCRGSRQRHLSDDADPRMKAAMCA
jgi:hypothetical protein